VEAPKPPPFAGISEQELLSYGVPSEESATFGAH
jgi:hypothetical protein